MVHDFPTMSQLCWFGSGGVYSFSDERTVNIVLKACPSFTYGCRGAVADAQLGLVGCLLSVSTVLSVVWPIIETYLGYGADADRTGFVQDEAWP